MLNVSSRSPKIIIKMFGEFSISAGDIKLSDKTMRTRQIWHLLGYLIAFRNGEIDQDELVSALWADAGVENPANALKNLIYRIRSTFSAHSFPYAKEMIVYSKGIYRWNNELDCEIDTEQMAEYYNIAHDTDTPLDLKITYYKKAIDLYKGDFFPGSSLENWVITASKKYRMLYFSCVYELIDLLFSEKEYNEIETVARKALEIDSFEENIHIALMNSLLKQKKRTEAMAHYGMLTELFFNELGINPSESLKELYKEMIKSSHSAEVNIDILEEELRDDNSAKGAFYCEYEVFKSLYQLSARSARRNGQAVFIALMTVQGKAGSDDIDLKYQSRVMEYLYEIIQSSLRRGDIFSRFSASQYTLMLSNLTFEDCEMVIDRILKRLTLNPRFKDALINTRIQPVRPVELN